MNLIVLPHLWDDNHRPPSLIFYCGGPNKNSILFFFANGLVKLTDVFVKLND